MSPRRLLALCCATLVLAAVALWVSSALPWYRVTALVPLRGPVPVTFAGGQVWPALLGLAPVSLAGVAAALALSGLARRVLGALLAALGSWVAVVAVHTVLWPTPTPLDPGYPTPPSGVSPDALRDQPLVVTSAPWVAVAGGLAMFAGGLWLATREQVLPRLGSRFTVRHDRRREPDQDRDWWDALDGGQDPTASTGPGADPRPAP
ncbi:MAG: Trp biosynthesis-associated membrane protein [Actinomycetota bacterium]|nr:Trp biosynthesis-associated membrane protein [Actinomycetota bacterium]